MPTWREVIWCYRDCRHRHPRCCDFVRVLDVFQNGGEDELCSRQRRHWRTASKILMMMMKNKGPCWPCSC